MICPECSQTTKGVVCIPCRIVRQRRGILLHQRLFLESWRKKVIDLRVREDRAVSHIELFDDRWHTYCGIDLFGIPPARKYMRELPPETCLKCRAVFARLADAADDRNEYLATVQEMMAVP